MSNVLAIIAEYNPLHNGHIYHINKAKEQTKADFVIAIISGNFTQRGNCSILNKWEKTKMTLEAGVDMVIELPTMYSVSSAENFASGAIKILKKLNIVTHISFGIENDDISELEKIADLLLEEPTKYKNILKNELKKGNSFPKARENAIIKYFENKKFEDILKGSNNILAIEYLKAIKQQKANIIPVGIKREKIYYNSKKVIDNYASSTGIRELLINNKMKEIKKVVPNFTFDILTENIKKGTYNLDLINFTKMIIYRLRTMSAEEISELPEVNEGLENLIKKSANETNNLEELINKLKSKRYTKTKIQRILIYALLDITKKDMEISKKIIPYVRILGISNKGKKMLALINNKAKIIASVKKFEKQNTNLKLQRLLEIDKKATNIYTIPYMTNSNAELDYTTVLIER